MIFLVLVAVVAGLIGMGIADSKGLNKGLWFVVCALFPIAILFVAFAKSEKPSVAAAEAKGYDVSKWKTLVEVDSEIANASKQILEYGQQAEDELAEKYLNLMDKNYLPTLLSNLISKYKELIPTSYADDPESQKILEDYLERVKNNNGKDTHFITSAPVKAATIYRGQSKSYAGALKIVLQDGKTILRSDFSNKMFMSEREADEFTA